MLYKTFFLKFIHIVLIISLTTTIVNGLINISLLSKHNIMRIIDYALSVINAEISPLDSIFIARLIRQQLWQVHFYSGVFSIILAMLVIVLFYRYSSLKIKKDMLISIRINVAILSVMAISGIFLFYRSELHLQANTVSLIRDLHWCGIYTFIIAIIFHFYRVFNSYKKASV